MNFILQILLRQNGGITIFWAERDYSMTDNTYCQNGFRKRLLSIEVRSPPQNAIKTMGENT